MRLYKNPTWKCLKKKAFSAGAKIAVNAVKDYAAWLKNLRIKIREHFVLEKNST